MDLLTPFLIMVFCSVVIGILAFLEFLFEFVIFRGLKHNL